MTKSRPLAKTRACIGRSPVWVILGVGLGAVSLPASAACQTTPTTQPATTPKSVSPEVEAVLDRLERADRELKDLQAEVEYSVLQLIKANDDDPDDVENFSGIIKFLKTPEPSRFFLHFDSMNDGSYVSTDRQQWIVFDGVWLTRASETGQSVEREQIVRPGEKSDLFKLGQGIFPMPFGQKKADMLKNFNMRLAPHRDGDPPGTDHLICETKKNSELADQFERIELFVCNDPKSGLVGMPLKIIAVNVRDSTRGTVIFSKIKKNKGLRPDRDFRLPAFTREWETSEKPLPPQQ